MAPAVIPMTILPGGAFEPTHIEIDRLDRLARRPVELRRTLAGLNAILTLRS